MRETHARKVVPGEDVAWYGICGAKAGNGNQLTNSVIDVSCDECRRILLAPANRWKKVLAGWRASGSFTADERPRDPATGRWVRE